MNLTWILILGFFGVVILIVLLRIIFTSYFKKNNLLTNSESEQQKSWDETYQKLFVELESIIETNKILNNQKENRQGEINDFSLNLIKKFEKKPEFIFSLPVKEFNKIVIDLTKDLKKQSPFVWQKNLQKQIAILNFKNIEFMNQNSELEKYKLNLIDQQLKEVDFLQNE